MAIIKSAESANKLTVDPTIKAARATLYNTAGVEVYPTTNQFIVTGYNTALVSAGQGATTVYISFKNGASKTVYITRIRMQISVGAVGASAGVPGVLGWQRFTGGTPTGGVQKIPIAKNPAHTSTVLDIRDLNNTLTAVNDNQGGHLDMMVIADMAQGAGTNSWDRVMDKEPWVLLPNQGIWLRSFTAMAATMTWQFAYTIEWFEV